jgi:hypothetical protein
MREALAAGLGLFFPTTEVVIFAPVPEELRHVTPRIVIEEGDSVTDYP